MKYIISRIRTGIRILLLPALTVLFCFLITVSHEQGNIVLGSLSGVGVVLCLAYWVGY
jgi:hypothetical protein